jgi:class 3 adenylate cyclase
MNVASRICSEAKAGEIFISESTREKIALFNLPLEKLELVKVKGKDEPLQLYRLLWRNVDVSELVSKTNVIFPSE